jgi:HPr kinase/phosphorylase
MHSASPRALQAEKPSTFNLPPSTAQRPMREQKTFQKESITVAFMVEQMQAAAGVELEAANPEASAADSRVTEDILNRPGLVLAGYTELFTHQRVQILGNTECRYLASLTAGERRAAFERLMDFPIPCLILTADNRLDDALVERATACGAPVFYTPLPTVRLMEKLRDFLRDQFAPQRSIHGALVDVYGIGLMLTGEPGIGKSEVALDLVERGHRLVADDVVIATRREGPILMGAGTDLVQHFMEVRGLGLVDVRAMYGVRAIRFQKRIEMVVRMQPWDADEEYTRLAMISETNEVMDVELPTVKVPVTPGKNISVICETIAMTHLLRRYGYDPAEVFAQRLTERIQKKGTGPQSGVSDGPPARGIEYFEHDYE